MTPGKIVASLSSSQENYLQQNFKISKNPLGEYKGKNQYNYHNSLTANATIFSCPVFSSTQRNVSRILQQSNDLRTDCMQYYSNYIQPKVLYRRTNFAVQRYSNIPTVWLISLIPLQKKKERSMAAKLRLV